MQEPFPGYDPQVETEYPPEKRLSEDSAASSKGTDELWYLSGQIPSEPCEQPSISELFQEPKQHPVEFLFAVPGCFPRSGTFEEKPVASVVPATITLEPQCFGQHFLNSGTNLISRTENVIPIRALPCAHSFDSLGCFAEARACTPVKPYPRLYTATPKSLSLSPSLRQEFSPKTSAIGQVNCRTSSFLNKHRATSFQKHYSAGDRVPTHRRPNTCPQTYQRRNAAQKSTNSARFRFSTPRNEEVKVPLDGRKVAEFIESYQVLKKAARKNDTSCLKSSRGRLQLALSNKSKVLFPPRMWFRGKRKGGPISAVTPLPSPLSSLFCLTSCFFEKKRQAGVRKFLLKELPPLKHTQCGFEFACVPTL
mmetsp:Transcript_8207/g.19663  ORF Transcript_8207/g.19663 Transcript_8207/m.19663 type:complete len:365 (-) Transcript_8207:698-1792(-)